VITSNKLSDVVYQVTHSKVFTFTTGSSSGTAPKVSATSPSEGAVLLSSAYSGGTISFTFDQTVELEPYSTVTATPVNGSEATASAKTGAPRDPNNSLVVGDDDKTVSFDYSEDQLKYDLYYKVVIPANTVVGVGGLPNASDITLTFKMSPKSGSLVSSPQSITYPYTWDMTKLGPVTTTASDLSNCTDSNGTSDGNIDKSKTSRWIQGENDGEYYNYWKNDMSSFPQGDVLSYNYNETEKEIKEYAGLRWSLASCNSTAAKTRVKIKKNNNDYYLVIQGNTHYLTIPNVPKGDLYISLAHADVFNVNSPNAVFTQGGMSGDNTKAEPTNTDKVYILNVTSAGDVSFCLDDVYFNKIAVATEEKEITSVGYATNARSYPVDYTLDGEFLSSGLTAYQVTGASNGVVTTQAVSYVPATTGANQKYGVMIAGSAGKWPLFTTDVNSTTEEMTDNKLIGAYPVAEPTGNLVQKVDNYYNYILSNGGHTVKYLTDEDNEDGKVTVAVEGLGFYLVMKSGTVIAENQTYSDQAALPYSAYLQLGEKLVVHQGMGTSSSARQFFAIDFMEEATGVKDVNRSKLYDSDGYYSMQGVKVSKPGKGLYIHHGKKIYVK